MQKPEIPTNESDRLVALDRYKILDTLPEQVYDDLTQLAADICGTPIALISLVDRDRQWFKSRVGLDATETSREISFCGHAVFENTILNVPDATQDPRFADNPLVVNDPSIRFYAGVPLKTPDNFTLGTLCVIDRQPRDLTTQQINQLESLSRLVISQLELRRNEQVSRLLNSVVESSNDAIITKNLDGIITSWNPAATRLFGYAADEMMGKSISILIPPDRLTEEKLILERLKHQEKIEHFETVRLHKDGSRLEVSVTISPLISKTGEVVGASKIVRDITASKVAEAQLKEISERLSLALKSGEIGCWEWDIVYNTLIWDDRMYELYGVTKESDLRLTYDIWSTGLHPDDREASETLIQQTVLGKAEFNPEFRVVHPDGSIHFMKAYGLVQRDDRGNPQKMIGVNFDISDRKEMESNLNQEIEERRIAAQKLIVLTERLELSNRELLDFAYVASHDLQEPLRKIQAFGDRLKSTCNDGLNEKGQDYLERMLNAAGRAQVLINDLLSFSRVTTQAKPFVKIDLSEILDGVLSDLEIRIEQTGATVERDRLPVIDADAMQMRQILQNLIGNALKFRQEGVTPLVQVRSRMVTKHGEECCEIRVIDNGIGFEQKYTDRIFQIFQRLHGRGTYEGTGIGLAICRKIAERHGGSLVAESEPNQGATFIFTMPIHQAQGDAHDAH